VLRGRGDQDHLAFDDYSEDVLANLDTMQAIALADDQLLQFALYKRDLHTDGRSLFYPLLRDVGSYTTAHQRLSEEFFAPAFRSLLEELQKAEAEVTPSSGGAMDDVQAFEREFIDFKSRLDDLLVRLQYNGQVDPLLVPLFLKKALVRSGASIVDIERAGQDFAPGSALYFLELFAAFRDKDQLRGIQSTLGRYNPKKAARLIERPTLMLQLWPHQQEAFQAWSDKRRQGILEMATATGKTVIGLRAIQDLSDEPPFERLSVVRVLAHSKAIVNQWRREAIEKLGLPSAPITGETPVEAGNVIIHFHTFQGILAARRRNPEAFSDCDLVIVDEVHHGAAPTFREAVPEAPRRLGLSATVEGGERARILNQVIGPTAYTLTVPDAIERGILPHFDWRLHPVDLEPDENEEFRAITKRIRKLFLYLQEDPFFIKRYGTMQNLGDFVRIVERARYQRQSLPRDAQELHAALLKRRWIIHKSRPKIEAAIRMAREYQAAGKKTIMFAMDIQTCNTIAQALQGGPSPVFLMHHKVKDPLGVLKQYRAADSGVLVGARMLDEGIDIPDAEIALNVASSKTRLQIIQRLGRILRKGDGKKEPVFHHFIGQPHGDLTVEDELLFLEDIGWANELALRIGVPAPQVEPSPTDPQPEKLAETTAKAEETLRAQYLRHSEIHIPDYGTFRPTSVLDRIPLPVIEALVKRLGYMVETDTLNDRAWIELLRRTHRDVQDLEGARDAIDIRGSWWLLVMAGRKPGELKRICIMYLQNGRRNAG
jgi:superfamily II DNA or RNA helicase